MIQLVMLIFNDPPSTILCSSRLSRHNLARGWGRSVEMFHDSSILTSVQVGHVSYYLPKVFQTQKLGGDVRFLNHQQ